jgi:membrane protein YdbS with pleckstrin-like domain
MDAIVAILQPILWPLLKLSRDAPRLPEGNRLVQAVSPAVGFLRYRYLGAWARFAASIPIAYVGFFEAGDRGGYGYAEYPRLASAAFIVVVVSMTASLAYELVARRIDFELRHYLIGDRSLRIAFGVLRREEVTVSYANIQNIDVTQGPIERLFGFQRLAITNANASAGEGGGGHVVELAGIEDAEATRALIFSLQRRWIDAGVGDDLGRPGVPAPLPSTELLAEVARAANALKDAALRHGAVQAHGTNLYSRDPLR